MGTTGGRTATAPDCEDDEGVAPRTSSHEAEREATVVVAYDRAFAKGNVRRGRRGPAVAPAVSS